MEIDPPLLQTSAVPDAPRDLLLRWGSRAWQAAGPLKPLLFRPCRALYRRLAAGRTTVVWIDGAWIAVRQGDPLARWILGGGMEAPDRRALAALLRPGDLFVDGGAHWGLYTVLAARGVGPSGLVVAFEPEAENRARLERTVAANGFGNVVVSAVALSDGARGALLVTDTMNSGGHSLFEAAIGDPGATVAVETGSLDELLPRLAGSFAGAPVVLKLDVQGAELAVLDGAARTLGRTRALLVEFTPGWLAREGRDPAELPRRLLAEGFSLQAFPVDSREPPYAVVPGDVAHLVARLTKESIHVNLLGVRGGR